MEAYKTDSGNINNYRNYGPQHMYIPINAIPELYNHVHVHVIVTQMHHF